MGAALERLCPQRRPFCFCVPCCSVRRPSGRRSAMGCVGRCTAAASFVLGSVGRCGAAAPYLSSPVPLNVKLPCTRLPLVPLILQAVTIAVPVIVSAPSP